MFRSGANVGGFASASTQRGNANAMKKELGEKDVIYHVLFRLRVED